MKKKENTKIERKENGEEAEVKITEVVITATEVAKEAATEVKEVAKEAEEKVVKEVATEAEAKVEKEVAKEVATEVEVAAVVTRIQTLMLMVSLLLRRDLTSLREAEVASEVAAVVTEVEEKVVIDPKLRAATEVAQDHPEEAEVKLEEKTSLNHLKPRQRLKLKNESALSNCHTILGVE
jgi:hypothetical protein